MKKLTLLFALIALATSFASAQQAKPAEQRTVTLILDRALANAEGEFVPAAEAMDEAKYNFAPTGGEFKGVRTFAQQIKHVAAVNYLLGSALLGEKSPADTGGENGPDSVKSKAEIVKYLKDSFAYLHKAYATINQDNAAGTVKSPFGEGDVSRLGIATLGVGHCFDHYGQMVVYLRMNGVIPPASRAQ